MSKHIYLGGERILFKLCDAGSMPDPTKDTTACGKNYTAKYADLTGKVKTRFDSLGVSYFGKDNRTSNTYYVAKTPPSGGWGADLYYFHSDHLGSASLITDGAGHLNQHLAYIPNGEVFINQQLTSFDSRYKFTGKEMDAETGLYYSSQRYLDSKFPGFISSDDLREKHPNIGSYVYCASNPIILTDQDGRDWTSTQWCKVKWYSLIRLNLGYTHEHFFTYSSYKSAVTAVNSMYKNMPQFRNAWNDVKSSKSTFSIDEVVPLRNQDGDVIEGGSQIGTSIRISQGEVNRNNIFEEVYHAAQGEFYNTNMNGMSLSKAIAVELEAKIAAAASGIDNGYGASLVGSLKEYMAAIQNGTPISSELKQQVNAQLKSYAEKLVAPQSAGGLGYEKLKNGIKDFNPNTALKYLENNLKKE